MVRNVSEEYKNLPDAEKKKIKRKQTNKKIANFVTSVWSHFKSMTKYG